MSAAQRPRTARYAVAQAGEIPPGGRKIVTVAGRSIGVFNVGGEFFALRNRCPHQGGALCEGRLWGVLQSPAPGEYRYRASREVVACPWHGWEFHLRTGQSWCLPERLKVSRYEVALVAAEELADAELAGDPPAPGLVRGPYVAETYPVAREGAWLVVDLPAAEHAGRARARLADPPPARDNRSVSGAARAPQEDVQQ